MKNGYRWAFIAAVISAVSITVNAVFVSQAVPAVEFVTARNLAVAVMLLVLNYRPVRRLSVQKLSRSDIFRLLAIGLLGGGLPFALFFSGLNVTGGVLANFINKTLFVWVALLSFVTLGDSAIFKKPVVYALVLSGLLLTAPRFSVSPGLFLILSATLLWSLEYVLSKNVLKRLSPDLVATARIVFGLPVLLVISFFQGASVVSLVSVAVSPQVLVSAVFLIAYMFAWYRALSLARASAVSLILTVSPVLAMIFDAYFRGKTIAPLNALAGLLVVSGLFIFLNRGNLRKPA